MREVKQRNLVQKHVMEFNHPCTFKDRKKRTKERLSKT